MSKKSMLKLMTIALFLAGTSIGIGPSQLAGQDDVFDGGVPQSKQAILLVDLNVDKLLANKTIETLAMAVGLNDIGPPIGLDEYRKIDRITFFMGSPRSRESETDFVARVKVKEGSEISGLVAATFPWEFTKTVDDGWTVLKSRRQWPQSIRYKGNLLEFGSPLYSFSPSRSIASKRMIDSFNALEKNSMARVVFDSQVTAGMVESIQQEEQMELMALQAMFDWGQFFNEYSIMLYGNRLLKEISTISFSADLDSDELAKLVIQPKKGSEASVTTKAQVLMDFLMFHAELPVKFLKESDSPLAGVFEKLTKAINMEQKESTIVVTLQKPENLSSEFMAIFKKLNSGFALQKDSNVMKQLALAVHNYHDTMKLFPFVANPAQKGRFSEDLSWRVKLMPFCEHYDKYDRMNLTEGWDSETNLKIVNDCKKQFVLSDGSLICGITMERPAKSFRDILDGSSNTIMMIQNPKMTMTTWSKPADVTVDEAVALVKALKPGQFLWVAMYDGSVFRLPSMDDGQYSEKEFRNMLDPRDGNVTRVHEILENSRISILPRVPKPQRRFYEGKDAIPTPDEFDEAKQAAPAIDEKDFDPPRNLKRDRGDRKKD